MFGGFKTADYFCVHKFKQWRKRNEVVQDEGREQNLNTESLQQQKHLECLIPSSQNLLNTLNKTYSIT